MTDTMIERVARAICRANVLSMMKVAGLQYHKLTVDAEVERLYRDDLPGARAAIEAMTEPTPNMLDDMRHEIGTTMHITLPDYALIAAWKMAVLASLSDAALQETKG